jgi:hypothetical protein
MSRDSYDLPPEGVYLPARYKKRIDSRRLFIDDAKAGLAGMPMDGAFLAHLLQQQGKAAGESYQDGHAEGTKARAVARKARSKTR